MNEPKQDVVEAALIAALQRDTERPPDRELLRGVSERLGESLGLGPGWAAGGASTTAASSALLHPLTVLVGSAVLGSSVLFGVSALTSSRDSTTRATSSVTSSAPATRPSQQRSRRMPDSEERPMPRELRNSRVPPPAAGVGVVLPSATRTPALSLGAQQALLDSARRSLARGDSAAALEALAWHASRFPRTVLEEEREALTVKALRDAGRTAEARVHAQRFTQRYPSSVFLPTVGIGLEANP
jgi:hypothetical protein